MSATTPELEPADTRRARGATILQVRDLAKTYGRSFLGKGGFRALDGVSLEVGRGQVFGLLGPNGAGKTTLIKVLLGLVGSYDGDARLFDLPAGHPDSRRRVGYLPEAHRLPGYLTGRQVIRLFAMMSGLDGAEADRRMARLLELVGMREAADRKVREYSKGMQQRIGIAQALVHEPELVFLDEPTDGVDPVGRASIRAIVQDLKARGVTIFINSHLLMEVELICDRVVIMVQGKILREGTIDELTPRTGSVRIELRAAPADLEQLLAGLGTGLKRDGNVFEVKLNDVELDQTIDRLRARGLGIRSLDQRRLSLEESFIDMVKKVARRTVRR
ncbi:MAG: ABC transporter ATP-binding protein [Planctomycetes bacterium]|nr:ABC transporter ATP-binding protein [Planctomycetota bacterium]